LFDQQRPQQTFHVQLLRLACLDASNLEAGAHSVWPGAQERDPHSRQGGLSRGLPPSSRFNDLISL
ncbi:MAG: hypothetical protein VX346_00240, partial [Planctomycetota bacterium]|nr:hypothetical protein [Planctomycetota bacterium]